MEGDTLLGFGHEHDSGAFSMNDQNGFDEFLCTPRCLTDTVTSGNVYADSILQHLYRWLCSPKSKLHDPTLHQLLHKVILRKCASNFMERRRSWNVLEDSKVPYKGMLIKHHLTLNVRPYLSLK
ncbi:DNA polymerase epsilon catalytic subunit A-like isoform X2 [Phaseolus vulgaris]|uniref:DNA polymerase epsilon catalytic subunit A-like isoform X2 n=1 Tax=Phaseolus vulgaris TaxID=3885 RepID=UPI0035CB1B08